MNTAHGTIQLGQKPASTRSVFFRKYWRAFQEWRQRNRLLDQLYQLDHRELNDLGISRGEIGYVASNPSIEPRGVLSGRS